jgi:thymidine kinase
MVSFIISKDTMSLELIIGPMFAGKSSALQSIVRRNKAIGVDVLVLKHTIDRRYLSMSENREVISHDKQTCPALECARLLDTITLEEFGKAQLIIVEEGQFFEDLVEFALTVVEKLGKDLVVVGLDGDAHRKPFGKILDLIPLADSVQRLYALCRYCVNGTPARFTCPVTVDSAAATLDGQPNVGGADAYQPLCRKHYLEFRPAVP